MARRVLAWHNVWLWSRIVFTFVMAALFIDDLQAFIASGRDIALMGAFSLVYLAVILIVWLPSWSWAFVVLVVAICALFTVIAPLLFAVLAAGIALAIIGDRQQIALLGLGVTGAVLLGMVGDRFSRLLWWTVPVAYVAGLGLGVLAALIREGLNRLAARTEALAVEEEEVRLQERARVAADLHDGLSQSLALISLTAGAAEESRSVEELQNALSEAAHIAREAREQMHELTSALAPLWRPDCVDGDGIPIPSRVLASLRGRSESVGRGLVVRGVDPLDHLSPGKRDLCCRALWEGTTNALQHAGPGIIGIEVGQARGSTRLVISSPLPEKTDRPPSAAAGRGLLDLTRAAVERGAELSAGPVGETWRLELVLVNDRIRPAGRARRTLGNRFELTDGDMS